MILILSKDDNFIGFCRKAALSAGYIVLVSDYQNALSSAAKAKPDTVVLHSPQGLKLEAAECASELSLRMPELKILAAVEKEPSADSLYIEIEGCNRQMILPVSKEELAVSLNRLSPASLSVKQLELSERKKGSKLLGKKLSLSSSDHTILRLTAKAYPEALDLTSLRAVFPSMSKNCLSVHISTINKAAARITERRLIIFKNGYRLNEYM